MIKTMGHFTAIGMRQKVEDPDALVITTCSDNDTAERGTPTRWSWSNPTNRAIRHPYTDIEAVSVECLWQGTKIRKGMLAPEQAILDGEWRRGKAKKPIGAWAGINQPLITNPGDARRAIYIPAFARLVSYWYQDNQVRQWVEEAANHEGPVYLRDFDTGRGVNRNGPMSHAWLLASWLNTGEWPDA